MENEKQNNTGLIITIAILVIVIIALVFGFGSYIVINNMKNELEKQQNNQVQEDDDKEEQNNNNQEKQEDKNKSENVVQNIPDNVDNTNNVQDSKEENTTTDNVPEEKEFTPVEGIGNKYVDLNNRSFAVNGKVYTLGKNTLQDMINGGVPFSERSLANANNNLNPNNESTLFSIQLGEYYSAYVSFGNYTDKNMKISECPLSEISLTINPDKEQNVLSFAFPLTITEQELVSKAGQATEESEYTLSSGTVTRTLEYTVKSTKYYGDSGYEFKFHDGKLNSIEIDYLK